MEVTFKGNYCGEAYEIYYSIGKKNLQNCDITVSEELYSDGNKIRPCVTVKDGSMELAEGTDYIIQNIRYDVLNSKGTLEVVASDGFYMGFDSANYTGTVTKEFSFEYAVELDKDTYDYTGNSIIPEVTVTLNDIVLANGTDYTVTCKNNTIPGTAGVKITGKDVYMATLNAEKEFTIAVAQAEGEAYEISLDKDSYSFTGWLVYPTVTVTKNGTALIEGTDYTVDYPVAVSKGCYHLTVYGTGSYAGKFYEVKDFMIVQGDGSQNDDNQEQGNGIQNDNQNSNVNGSIKPPVITPPNPPFIQNQNNGSNASGSTQKNDSADTQQNTQVPKVKKASMQSVKSTAKKTMTVKWKKVTEASGYQIQYSTKSNFKNAKTVTIKKGSTTTCKVKKLSSKKKYYVRVRAYKTVNGKKYYGSWSSKKSVKIK